MDSRELLVLLDGMPEDSEYKRALTGYPYGVDRDWTKSEYRETRLITEIAVANNSFDLEDMVSPVERAIVDMKERGQWPPTWWSQDWKDAVTPSDQPNGVAAPQVTEADYDAVHELMINQLYGRS